MLDIFDKNPAYVEAYERGMTARVDRDFGILLAQSADFQQRTTAMMAALQPVPPLMILAFADELSKWIERFRQAQSDAEWLAGKGRPAMRQRLTAIIDELKKAVAIYQQQVAGQGVAHQQGAARQQGPATTMAGTNPEVAKIMRETEKIESDTRAATEAAVAKRNEMYNKMLFGR